MTVERYESKGGKYWVELTQDDTGWYSYQGDSSGGSLGRDRTSFDRMVAGGYFQPDANTTPMRKVNPRQSIKNLVETMSFKEEGCK